MKLNQFGWNNFFEDKFSQFRHYGLIPGRIVRETRHIYDVQTETGRYTAQVSGHFQYIAVYRSDYPAIGDWVAVTETDGIFIIEKVLERQSKFSRKAAGKDTDEQIIAANIDKLLIINSLDGGRNFNLRAIERYISMAEESGAEPVVVLNKSDLCSDTDQALLEAESVTGDIPVYAVSAVNGTGIDELKKSCGKSTVALTGPSGVGKSALINAFLGKEIQQTGLQRQDDLRGRHTTTHKELFFLSGGLMLIDTPGLRELGIWADERSINNAFNDIAILSAECRFKNCSHQNEPGCAVQKALSEGELDYARFENYLSIKNEISFLNSKDNIRLKLERKSKEKKLSRLIKDLYK